MFRTLIILLISFWAFGLSASTLGIVTGKYTIDGRPILLKNKDRTDAFPSDVNVYHSDTENDFIYQLNDGQSSNYVRMGMNEWGLGIVYTDSENLEGASSGPSGSQLTSIALKTCRSIGDFRALLLETNGERTAHNHFGVIDSSGEGAAYEVSGFSFVELPVIDTFITMANTAKFHPDRSAPASGSTSPQREFRMMELFLQRADSGISYQYCMEDILKDYSSNQDDEDAMPLGQYETNAVLSRYKTAAGGVLRGIKPGDNPALYAIMQLCIGEPSSSFALPYSFVQPEIPDEIRSGSADYGIAGIQDLFRQEVYNYTDGRYGDRTANTNVLTAIQNALSESQNRMYAKYDSIVLVYSGYENEVIPSLLADFLNDIDLEGKEIFYDVYEELFNTTEILASPSVFSGMTMQVYPNPSNAEFVIKWTFEKIHGDDLQIQLYNLKGNLLMNHHIDEKSILDGFLRLSAKSLSSGTYLVVIRNKHSVLQSEQIIIIK